MKFKVIDKKHRSVLSEGRDAGIGHAFCKRNGDLLTTISPVSACKDYCNDVVYSEQSGKPYSAHGLKTKKEGIFDTYAYLLMAVCKEGASNPQEYPGWKEEVAEVKEKFPQMEKFMNAFEKMFKFKDRTEIQEVEDNLYAIVVPIEWVQATYLISLYTLLIRQGHKWNGKQDVMEFLKDKKTCPEYMTFTTVLPKIKSIAEGKHKPQDWTKQWCVHHTGIVAWPVEKNYP